MFLSIIFIFLVFISFININRKNQFGFAYFFILICLIIICAIRYRVGGDTLAYYDKFFEYPTVKELFTFNFKEAQYNPSWYIFNAISKSINDSFYTFQLLHAIIVNSVIFWFMARYSLNKYFILPFYFFLYFLYFNMEILREALAVAVFLIAIPLFLKKSWIKYYLLCCLALTFHNSALILFTLPLFSLNLKVSYQIALFVFSSTIVGFLSTGNFLFSIGIDKLFGSNSLFYLNKEFSVIGTLYQLLKLIPVFLIFSLAKSKNISSVFEKFIFPYIIIGICGSFIPGIYRFLNYLSIPILIYCINILYIFYFKRNIYTLTFLKVQFCVGFLILFQLHYFFQDRSELAKIKGVNRYDLYTPFYTIFDERIHDTRETFFYNQFEGNL
ncbi:EpsG family protein [Sphingobacterium cavernae]|uniref:EpsG family protein n=1 Tax=Sphingobacterium cavernae TaxID=2592657 RepID=UPI00123019B5|nr:EpsG family protein [Sphingobacterium cavernae]